MEKQYICIDLKSFYASVEAVERGLDPLVTNLVVADPERTEKTICLAVSPALKSYGISGRPRLFEVIAKVKEINQERLQKVKKNKFKKKSVYTYELNTDYNIELDYVIAPPRMAKYIDYSTRIYKIYLQYISAEDIHVYSIDEVFMDVTAYLKTYNLTAKQLASKIILNVFEETGITATAGVGTNMYLAKVAMDILAKHIKPDENGVRIACLDEEAYKKQLWSHEPLSDFWRVGVGYEKRLAKYGLYTMGDIARFSILNEDKLFDEFGINAELLIDHAWGVEPCTMSEVKGFKTKSKSIGSGQVLHCPYDYEGASLIVKEMMDDLALTIFEKQIKASQIVLSIGYDINNIKNNTFIDIEFDEDYLGRKVPKGAHGSINISEPTNSSLILTRNVMALFNQIVDKRLQIRRINIALCNLFYPDDKLEGYRKLNLFDDFGSGKEQKENEQKLLDKELKAQEAIMKIKKKYGKNAVIKGMSLQDESTIRERNNQIGGHKA